MVNIGHTQLHTYPSAGENDRPARSRRTQLTRVRGGNYQFSFASEKLSACSKSDRGMWGFNSAVAAQF
jgi:hypothetical protein